MCIKSVIIQKYALYKENYCYWYRYRNALVNSEVIMSIVRNIKNHFYYALASIKNRYPCKIIKVKDAAQFDKPAVITYRAVTKYNLRKCNAEELLEDQVLIEKFHPTDGVKLGFLAAGEILLKQKNSSIKDIRNKYIKVLEGLFKESGEIHNDSE